MVFHHNQRKSITGFQSSKAAGLTFGESLEPRHSDLIVWGGGLGVGAFESFPGDTNVQPKPRPSVTELWLLLSDLTVSILGPMPHLTPNKFVLQFLSL